MMGRHHALVLSDQQFNVATGWVVVCPITSQIKGSPFEVQIPAGGKTCGCVVASEIRTLDWQAKQVAFIEKAPVGLLQQAQAIALAMIT